MFKVGNDVNPEVFNNLVEMLKARPLLVNRHRFKSGVGRSQVFGICKQRNSRYSGSRFNIERPELYAELLRIGAAILPPEFSYTSIQLNQNYQTAEHRDVGNRGESAIIAFGDFTGGDLYVEETPVNIKNRLVFFDGSIYRHHTAPFTGDRFSLVFHTPNRDFKAIPTYTPIPVVERGRPTWHVREELNGLVRLWKKNKTCISSSDNVMPVARSRKHVLLECVEE